MIILMDNSSVSEPLLPGSATSMNSSIISTSLLHHQAEFGSKQMVSIHLFHGCQFGPMALSVTAKTYTHRVLLNYYIDPDVPFELRSSPIPKTMWIGN